MQRIYPSLISSIVKKIAFVSIPLMVLALVGCGSGGVDSSDAEKKGLLTTPAIVDTSALPEAGELKTYLTIDDEAREEIVLSNNSTSLQLEKYAQGNHTFLIEFEFHETNKPIIQLAKATIEVNVGQGDNPITFTEFDFPDSNSDGKTNLDALVENLDPNACVLGSSTLSNCSLTL